jgi:hypothetical protein
LRMHAPKVTHTNILYYNSKKKMQEKSVHAHAITSVTSGRGLFWSLMVRAFLTTEWFPHDNFSSVYWIFNKLGHMIPLWKGKNPT